jgi:AcrR family transcriptional regulator
MMAAGHSGPGALPDGVAGFEAQWDRLEAEYLRRLAEACEGLSDWRERFRAAAATTVRLAEENPLQARFMTVEALALGEPARRRQQALAARLAACIDGAREQLENPEAVPPATAPWVVSVFFDRIYRRFVSDPGPDLVSQLPELMFIAVSSYFGTEAGLEELGFPP